mmetsp:Transcript_29333/g.65676  ORF Transcript_29333/g.65676 Transcript_29333/m.65676 type:complete len:228 (-) Transcript_29333:463-1146(-)
MFFIEGKEHSSCAAFRRASGLCAELPRSPRDKESVLAVDKLSRFLHAHLADLVQHTLRALGGGDRALDVPDVLVLLGHLRAVEPGVKHHHRHAFGLEFFGEESGGHVARGATHVVPVVAAFVGVLGGAPLHASSLRADHNGLGALLKKPRLEKCSVHAEGAEPADVDLFDLLLEIQAALDHGLPGPVEVAGVVDDNVERLPSLEVLRHLVHRCGVGDVDARDHLVHP